MAGSEAGAPCRPRYSALYGLSPSQIGLANELCVGRSVQEAFAGLGITVNPTRSKLKHMLAKRAVRSQAELPQLPVLGLRPA